MPGEEARGMLRAKVPRLCMLAHDRRGKQAGSTQADCRKDMKHMPMLWPACVPTRWG